MAKHRTGAGNTGQDPAPVVMDGPEVVEPYGPGIEESAGDGTAETVLAETPETKGPADWAVQQERLYQLSKLRSNCAELFGVSSSTFDGAMYGHKGEAYTVSEVKQIIDVFLYGEGGR